LTSFEATEQQRLQIEEELSHITLTEQSNREKLWERCKTAINSMAEEVLGIIEPAGEYG